MYTISPSPYVKSTHVRKAFTLVELLTVIAIIGILSGMLYPAITGGMIRAKQIVALNNVGQIAKSHYTTVVASPSPVIIGVDENRTVVQNINEWAIDLAKKGGINESSFYFAGNFTPLAAMHETIYNDRSNIENVDFKNTSRIAYNVVAATRSNLKGTPRTALIWTTDGGKIFEGGIWNQGSPWGDDGGHVAYADGHVIFYKSTLVNDQGVFTDYKTGKPTHDPGRANPSVLPGAIEKVVGPKQ